MAGQLIFSPYVLLPFLLYIGYAIFARLTKPTDAFDVLPWINLPKGPFAKLRARYDPTSRKETIGEAFKQYNLKGLSFIYPSFLSSPKILLPPSQVQWLIDQPDDVLSFNDAVQDQMTLHLTTLSPLINENPLHHDVIKGALTRSLSKTSTLVMDELRQSFSTHWGDDGTQWNDHCVWESMTKIFAQTSGRIFIGLPLCRNQEFLTAVVRFAECVIQMGTLLRGVPSIIKDIFGYFLVTPNRNAFKVIWGYVGPVIEERKSHMLKKQENPDYEWEEPFDLLQWSINRAYESGDPREIDSTLIAKRFAVVCFAAIHTTSLTTTNLILDILSADPEYDTISKLREEIVDVYQQSGKWDKQAMAKLVRLDSVVRESQRLHAPGSLALHRKVRAKEGVKMPDGVIAPYDSDLAFVGFFLQRDEDVYENPDVFDPFRWSRPRESFYQSNGKANGTADNIEIDSSERTSKILKERNAAAVSTGLTHLPFGHGRHACPGRFFAIQEVKLMAVHVIMNYELKRLDERPQNPWYGDLMTPNTNAIISARKIKSPIG